MEQDGEAHSVNITSQCRKITNLTAMQIEHLKRIEISLPFVADLAHAYLYLYVQTKELGRMLVLKHYRPHTFFSEVELTGEGAFVSTLE